LHKSSCIIRTACQVGSSWVQIRDGGTASYIALTGEVRSTDRDTVEEEEQKGLIEILRLTGRIILKMILPDPCSQSPVPIMGDC
jgi:hypothetical protein